MTNQILIVDDDPHMRFFLSELGGKEGYEATACESGEAALAVQAQEPHPVVLMDLRMPGLSGLETMARILEAHPDTVVIVITAHGSKETALEAMGRGAYDYFTKPVDIQDLRVVLRRAMEKVALQREVARLRQEALAIRGFGELLGSSPAMQGVFHRMRLVKDNDVTVLLVGETGTGKELVARTIHQQGPRAQGTFVAVNCAAIPETLLEAELFGHEKGAFTGAIRQKPGRFEQAHGGTLFLDEVGDMSPAMQAKILRVLQEHTVIRLGGGDSIPVDIRLIAATHRDLEAEVRGGRFREDLYYRLNGVPIPLPPLRERLEDVPLLAEHCLHRAAQRTGMSISPRRFCDQGLAPEGMRLLMAHTWPGNVRELEHVIQRAVLMETGRRLGAEAVQWALNPLGTESAPRTASGEAEDSLQGQVEAVKIQQEKALILEALQRHRWRREDTARALGISRRTLFNKMKRYGLG